MPSTIELWARTETPGFSLTMTPNDQMGGGCVELLTLPAELSSVVVLLLLFIFIEFSSQKVKKVDVLE